MATTKKPTVKKKKRRRFSGKKLLVWCLVAAALAVICGLIGYMFIIIKGQKELTANIDQFEMAQASIILDSTGKEVTTIARENREIVEYKDIPEKLLHAFIATEDKRFNEHSGIDYWSIGRAVVKDIIARKAVEGGSTITQQLAKNMFLNSDKTLFRKATEMSIASALEIQFTKEEILNMYLNQIYFGNRAYGIKAASKKFFGKSDLNTLEIWEMATLAAIPKAPTHYSPLNNPERSKERRGVVLRLMTDQGYITEAERAQAAAVDYVPQPQAEKKGYLTFIDFVMAEASDKYGIEEDKLLRGGYRIQTTMNAEAQLILEQTFDNEKWFQKNGPTQQMQAAMAIVNHKDGGLVAIIGGRDYETKGFNRAIKPRQPGSSIKPLVVFGPAIESGKWNPYSKLKDAPLNIGGYKPTNINGQYSGEMTMIDAFRRSTNSPAVWLLNEIGLKSGMQFAKNLGITFDDKDNNLAIALGGMTQGASPLQMASAFGAFGNNGQLAETHSIIKISAANGDELGAFKSDKTKRVMSEKTAYYMTEMMKAVVEPGGTGTSAKLNRPTAGKTGSTQLDIKGLEKYNRDLWFAGYTPEWSAAVWMGFDNTDNNHHVTVSSGNAAVLFKEVMSKALAKVPVKPFTKPSGVPDLKEPPKSISELTAVYIPETRRVKLGWSAGEDKVTYQIFRKEAKDQEFVKILEVVDALEMFDISIKPGESYEYYVVPFNPQTNVAGEKSNVAAVTVPAENSPTPSPSVSPSKSPSLSPTPSPSGSGSPTGSSSPGITVKPSVSATPKPSGLPNATATATSSATPVTSVSTSPAPTSSGVLPKPSGSVN